jgi:hypothetical protein
VPVVVNTPDGASSNTTYVAITAPAPVIVTISPTSATVRVGRSRTFTATVSNSLDKTVIWKVNGVVGGNAVVGTVSAIGPVSGAEQRAAAGGRCRQRDRGPRSNQERNRVRDHLEALTDHAVRHAPADAASRW